MSDALPRPAGVTSTPIRFQFRGRLHEVSEVASTSSILDWLRLNARAVGTKEGCAEGDCGACTVALAQLDDDAPGGVRISAINACIHLLGMLDGKALLTVEDLAPGEAPLHPVQQAMVDCHASQCGFCTPGFVMSLFGLYEGSTQEPSREAVCHAIAGNLCRCTGYRPIVDAARRAYDLPPARLDRAPLRAALEALLERPSLDFQAPAALGGGRISAPSTLTELAALYLAHPHARILAGATDIGLWITKQGRALPHLIHLDRVPELHVLQQQGDELVIGAAVTHSEAWPFLVQRLPGLADLARRFAAPTVCNAGTLGGNVANGSPIGDAMPPLLALDSTVRLQRGTEQRDVLLADFYTGYQTNVMQAGEFLSAVKVPVPRPGIAFACYKISKRLDQDISAVCAAFLLELDEGVIVRARVAFGGMAAIPKRAPGCEAALVGGTLGAATLLAAQTALAHDFSPLSDMRASLAYRSHIAGSLLERFWLEVSHPTSLLRVEQARASA